MARKHVPLWNAFNASLTIHRAKSAHLFGVLPVRSRAAAREIREDPTLSITDLPLFSMLRSRMQWHQERQRVLAQNVANSDTRDFQPRDLNALKFENVEPGRMTVSMRRTDSSHMNSSGGSATGFQTGQSRGFESKPSGSTVVLEDEMMKVAANQMDYQAASSLYTKSLGLIKIAIGKR